MLKKINMIYTYKCTKCNKLIERKTVITKSTQCPYCNGNKKDMGDIINGYKIIDALEDNRYVAGCLACGKISVKTINQLNYIHKGIKKKHKCYCERISKHGHSKEQIYKTYQGMIQRTTNPNVVSYRSYGKKGIKVCDEWLNDFMSFYKWSYENGYKEGLSIDRIDNKKGYSPENCRWVTMEEQYKNRG